MNRRLLVLLGFGVLVACGARASQNDDGGDDGGSSSSSGGSSSGSSGATGSSGTSNGSSSGSSSGSQGGSSSGGSGSGSSSGSTSSSGSSGSSSSSSSSSGSSSGDAGQFAAPAKLVVVHAAPGLGPFRLCLATSVAGSTASVAPLSALPDAPGWSGGSTNPPSANGAPVPAGSPGFYPGTVQAFPDVGTSLQALAITPFVIDSAVLAGDVSFDGGAGIAPDGGFEENCLALIGSHGMGSTDSPVAGRLTPGVDYWKAPTVPAGTFVDGNTYLFAITGCVPGYAVGDASVQDGITTAGTCGAGFGTSGNLAFQVNELDTTSVVSGLGVQFVNLSTPLQDDAVLYSPPLTHPAASDGVLPGYLTADGGFVRTRPATPVDTTSGPLPALFTIPAEADGGVGAAAIGALTLPGSDDGGAANLLPYPGAHPQPGASAFVSGDLLALPLSEIVTMSNWSASTSAAPTSFANGQTYTVILLGNNDPTVTQLIDPDLDLNPTAYDGRGMHLVAFPNRFTAIPLP